MAANYQTAGGAVPLSMGPTGAAMFLAGVGITNREDGDDESCGCPNRGSCHCCAYCCGQPMFFSGWFGDQVGKESTIKWGWCCGWTMEEADVLGVPASFKGNCCGEGCCGCCEPSVEVYRGHNFAQKIGRAQRKCHCYTCCNETMAEAYDAQDNLRFKRTQNTSCCKHCFRTGGACSCCWCCSCYKTFDFPVQDASGRRVAAIRERECCNDNCACWGRWTGIPSLPQGMSDDDKMILVAMVLTKWWRSKDESAEEKEAAEAAAAEDLKKSSISVG